MEHGKPKVLTGCWTLTSVCIYALRRRPFQPCLPSFKGLSERLFLYKVSWCLLLVLITLSQWFSWVATCSTHQMPRSQLWRFWWHWSRCSLGITTCKSSPGDPNVQSRLRPTALYCATLLPEPFSVWEWTFYICTANCTMSSSNRSFTVTCVCVGGGGCFFKTRGSRI